MPYCHGIPMRVDRIGGGAQQELNGDCQTWSSIGSGGPRAILGTRTSLQRVRRSARSLSNA